MTKINYQMPDEVWNVIKQYADREKGADDYWFKFEGDFGNWNFLFARMLDAYSDTFNSVKADIEADIESKNKLRKQRDAASERALIYAAKLGELQQENSELKIRLEMEGIEG